MSFLFFLLRVPTLLTRHSLAIAVIKHFEFVNK